MSVSAVKCCMSYKVAAAAYFHHVEYAPNACIAGALRCGVTFAEFVVVNVQDGHTRLYPGKQNFKKK